MSASYNGDGTGWVVNVPDPLGMVNGVPGDPRSNLFLQQAYGRTADRGAYLKDAEPIYKTNTVSGSPLSPTYNYTNGWSGGNDYGSDQMEPNSYVEFPNCNVGDRILIDITASGFGNGGLSGPVAFAMAIDDVSGVQWRSRVLGTDATLATTSSSAIYGSIIGVWTVTKAGTTRIGLGCFDTIGGAVISFNSITVNATLFGRGVMDPTQNSALTSLWRDYTGSSPWNSTTLGPTQTGSVGVRTSVASTSTTTASSYTCNITPAVNDLFIVFVSMRGNAGIPTVTDNNGGSYTALDTTHRNWDNLSASTFVGFVRTALVPNTTATTITATTASGTAASCIITAVAIKGMASAGAGAIRQTKALGAQTAASTPTAAWASTPIVSNLLLAAVTDDGGTGVGLVPPNGASGNGPGGSGGGGFGGGGTAGNGIYVDTWTKLQDIGATAGGSTPIQMNVAAINFGDTTGTVTWGSNANGTNPLALINVELSCPSLAPSAGFPLSGGTAPTNGSTLNSHNTALFNGTTQSLATAAAISSLFSASAWSIWMLVNNALPGSTMCLVEDANGVWGLEAVADGSNDAFKVFPLGSPFKGYPSTLPDYTPSTWALIQAKYDGTYVWTRVNHGMWVAQSAVNIPNLAGVLHLGLGTALGLSRFAGTIAEIGTSNTALSDSFFDALVAYVNNRYALSL